jgi:hypothetical protein
MDMKLELVPMSVTDLDRAKAFLGTAGNGVAIRGMGLATSRSDPAVMRRRA